MPHQIVKHVFQLPDAEEPSVVVNRRREHAAHPSLDPLDGIAVQHADEKTVLGDPTGFRKGFIGIGHKLEGGEEAGVVERIVAKRQIFGEPPIKVRAVADFAQRNIQHVGRRVNARHLQAHVQKGRQA